MLRPRLHVRRSAKENAFAAYREETKLRRLQSIVSAVARVDGWG